jgi:flagellar L-ring protein precursor FlgH
MRVAILIAVLIALLPGWAAAASLYQAETLADGTLYSDQVARRVGDLITIVVKETTKVTDKNKTKTKRDTTIDTSLKVVPGSNQLPAAEGSSTIGALPAFKAEGSKQYEGEGNYEHTGEVEASITARVIDVLDNGNLVVEGRRQVKVNKDSKTILITGIVRTADVKADNTVMSEKLHNFQVSIEGEGPLSRAQGEGWLATIIDVVWPF